MCEHNYNVVFAEFKDLGDPAILGMPFIDSHGGLQTFSKTILLADLHIPRAPRSRNSVGRVCAMSRCEVVTSNNSLGSVSEVLKPEIVVDDSG